MSVPASATTDATTAPAAPGAGYHAIVGRAAHLIAAALALALLLTVATAAAARAEDGPPAAATPGAPGSSTGSASGQTVDVPLAPGAALAGDAIGLGRLAAAVGDPEGWVRGAVSGMLLSFVQAAIEALRDWLNRMCCAAVNFLTSTPPTLSYANTSVRGLWGTVRTLANAGLVLAAAWSGLNLIFKEHLGATYHEAMEAFPRLALGALLVNTSLWWAQFAIDANNALSYAIAREPLPAWLNAIPTERLSVALVAALVYVVMGIVLLLQQLARLALVDLLLVLAPLGLLCWILPQTQGWARLWSTTFVAAVFTQFVQAVALRVGSSLVADYAGQPSGDAPSISLFLGIATLFLTLRIPSLMRVVIGDGLGLARYYIYRRAGQAFGLNGRGGGGGGGAAGSAGSGASGAGARAAAAAATAGRAA